jgi:hypothetical protein
VSTKFKNYTEIHWYEIAYLERRLVEGIDQAHRAAHTRTTWTAIMELVGDGVFEQTRVDDVAPLFALTDVGWKLAGRLRRWQADRNLIRDFVYEPDEGDSEPHEHTAKSRLSFHCEMAGNSADEHFALGELLDMSTAELQELSQSELDEVIRPAFDDWQGTQVSGGWEIE